MGGKTSSHDENDAKNRNQQIDSQAQTQMPKIVSENQKQWFKKDNALDILEKNKKIDLSKPDFGYGFQLGDFTLQRGEGTSESMDPAIYEAIADTFSTILQKQPKADKISKRLNEILGKETPSPISRDEKNNKNETFHIDRNLTEQHTHPSRNFQKVLNKQRTSSSEEEQKISDKNNFINSGSVSNANIIAKELEPSNNLEELQSEILVLAEKISHSKKHKKQCKHCEKCLHSKEAAASHAHDDDHDHQPKHKHGKNHVHSKDHSKHADHNHDDSDHAHHHDHEHDDDHEHSEANDHPLGEPHHENHENHGAYSSHDSHSHSKKHIRKMKEEAEKAEKAALKAQKLSSHAEDEAKKALKQAQKQASRAAEADMEAKRGAEKAALLTALAAQKEAELDIQKESEKTQRKADKAASRMAKASSESMKNKKNSDKKAKQAEEARMSMEEIQNEGSKKIDSLSSKALGSAATVGAALASVGDKTAKITRESIDATKKATGAALDSLSTSKQAKNVKNSKKKSEKIAKDFYSGSALENVDDEKIREKTAWYASPWLWALAVALVVGLTAYGCLRYMRRREYESIPVYVQDSEANARYLRA